MISFVYSVPEKIKGVVLPDYPVQIIPYSRTRINEAEIKCYPIRTVNNGGVVHVSYLCHPFGKRFEEFSNVNMLKTYKKLCERIKYNFLCHGPSNSFEMENIEKGMAVIREVFKDFTETVIIEIPSFNSGMKIPLDDYISKISKEFPETTKFGFCIDTAHMWANGCDTQEIIRLCKKYKNLITVIHLNGNEKEQFRSDVHVEIFNSKSKLTNIKDMMNFFKENKWLMIAEVTRAEFGYNDWKTFADSYEIPIVDFSPKLIIKHERILGGK